MRGIISTDNQEWKEDQLKQDNQWTKTDGAGNIKQNTERDKKRHLGEDRPRRPPLNDPGY